MTVHGALISLAVLFVARVASMALYPSRVRPPTNNIKVDKVVASAAMSAATTFLSITTAHAIPASASDPKGAIRMVTLSRDRLKIVQKLDDLEEIKSTTHQILDNELKASIQLALDSSLSIEKDGKTYYNTVKFHGNTAVDDIQLIQDWFTADRPSKKAPEDRKADQLAFAKQASNAAVEELDKFIQGVTLGGKIKDARGGPKTLDIYREIEINMQ